MNIQIKETNKSRYSSYRKLLLNSVSALDGEAQQFQIRKKAPARKVNVKNVCPVLRKL